MAGADIRTKDISGRQHRAAPTTSPAVWYKTAGGLALAREGHLIRPSGPPSPQRGRLLTRTFHASPNRGGAPEGGGGVCLPLEGERNSEEVRWPQSGRIKICRHRRHHTYSLFTITSYFDYPSVSFADSSPFRGAFTSRRIKIRSMSKPILRIYIVQFYFA